MSAEHPQPSLADVLSAVAKEHGDGAAYRVHKVACKIMWRRLIDANQRLIEAEIAGLRNLTGGGTAYRESQRRLDALFAERNRLSDAAYGKLPALEVRT